MSQTETPIEVEFLAAKLHRDFRAASKALLAHHIGGAYHDSSPATQHDHGWESCHRKKYFRQRAARQLKEASSNV
jgi:hypothetical protein